MATVQLFPFMIDGYIPPTTIGKTDRKRHITDYIGQRKDPALTFITYTQHSFFFYELSILTMNECIVCSG
jgi:hypothetical protein